jgi:hypothetical protein
MRSVMTRITYLDLENACPRTQWYGIDFEHKQTVDLDQVTHLSGPEKEEMIEKAKGNRFFMVEEAASSLRLRPRGAPPRQMTRLLKEMASHVAQHGLGDLAAMTQEEMAQRFGAARSTCQRARLSILSRNGGN